MKTNYVLFVVLISALFLAACGPAPIAATATPAPTNTPTVTPTPLPTDTPTPLPTDTPTLIPSPTKVPVLGIDTPITVNARGTSGTLQFVSAILNKGPIEIGGKTYTGGKGMTILKVAAQYTGDMVSYFIHSYQGNHLFYVTDNTGNYYNWVSLEYDSMQMGIGFKVHENAAPYILHSAVGTPWQVDLTPLLQVSSVSEPIVTPEATAETQSTEAVPAGQSQDLATVLTQNGFEESPDNCGGVHCYWNSGLEILVELDSDKSANFQFNLDPASKKLMDTIFAVTYGKNVDQWIWDNVSVAKANGPQEKVVDGYDIYETYHSDDSLGVIVTPAN